MPKIIHVRIRVLCLRIAVCRGRFQQIFEAEEFEAMKRVRRRFGNWTYHEEIGSNGKTDAGLVCPMDVKPEPTRSWSGMERIILGVSVQRSGTMTRLATMLSAAMLASVLGTGMSAPAQTDGQSAAAGQTTAA